MPGWDLLLAFLAATALFAFFPGPALLYTAAQTLARGRRAGLMAALGIHIGCYAHILAAVFGLSAIFATAPLLYTALKIAGAVYLLWLGYKMIAERNVNAELPHLTLKTARRAFAESIIVELLNPKVAIFFIAFLPQFVSAEAALPIWAQFLILGMFVNLSFTTADLLTVFFTSAVVARVKSSRRGAKFARMLAGTGMIALGAHLATSKN